MAICKACGQWFSSSQPEELCPACERALKRLGEYVTPVRHGCWIGGYKGSSGQWTYEKPRCSECGEENNGAKKYCPNCGAMMDKEET